MGRLLCEVGAVNKQVMEKYKQESELIGKGSFAYAWVMDTTETERSKGVTIEVSQQNFETEKKRVTILDAPGHLDFIPNMISGASQADFAILIVDSTSHFESGFSEKGQTREHALLARNLGVSHLIVAVNKLDLSNWSEKRYSSILSKLSTFLQKTVGYKQENIHFVPIGGLQGVNLSKPVTSSVPELFNWYKGPCLTQAIDSLPPASRPTQKPFRMAVDDIYKLQNVKGFVVTGKIVSGIVSVSDNLLVMPIAEKCVVKSIQSHGESFQYAKAGDTVDITITKIEFDSVQFVSSSLTSHSKLSLSLP